jgi:hypothetical protein
MKGLMAGAVLLGVAAALAGCSAADNKSNTPPQASIAAPVAGSTNPGAAAPSATGASNAKPSVAPAAGGTATDFCGAFKVLEAINDNEAPSGDLASVGTQMQAAAADMRKYAPAEIQKAANTYADLMDSIGKAVAGGSIDEASLAKAISDGMAGNAKDIGTTAVWVAKNCKL